MKVLFVYSPTDPKLSKNYNLITATLENSGNKVIASKLSLGSSIEESSKAYHKLISTLKKIDIVVVESSNPSNGIGFLVATALNEKKPVLALSETKNKKSIEAFWYYAQKNKLLTYYSYTLKDLEKVINEYVNKVKKIIDTKFILIISPEIDTYLQWASDNRRMHKAQVVRRAVEEVMRNDKEFKKHITSLKKS
jgi:hypothetical protein